MGWGWESNLEEMSAMKLTIEIDDELFPKLQYWAKAIDKTPEEVIKGHIENDLGEVKKSLYEDPRAMVKIIQYTSKRLLQYLFRLRQ